ncbi:MAG: S53 family peptidase [Holophagaceae bacterium]
MPHPNHASWGQSALAFTFLLGLAGGTTGQAAAPAVVAADQPQTISLVLKLRNQPALEAYIAQTVDPASASYHKFMTTEAFAATFGPSPADLRTVTAFLEGQGLKVEEVHANHLVIRTSGTTAQFNALLNTQVVQHTDEHGRAYQKPLRAPQVPAHLASHVLAAVGLNTKAAFRPHVVKPQRAANGLTGAGLPAVVLPAAGAVATGVPGSYTVGDVANLYNINPLYSRRITGRGRTLGIATLASFNPADAFAYWSAVGLTVDPNRITQVLVDGGSGTDGAEETTLDVQQSGGVAYGAKIMVYQAPNTDAGFLDLFSRAVSDNKVDTLSVSWGLGEAFYDDATLAAYHQVFLQAAVQGIPVFASSGDSGAFDLNRNFPTPYFSPTNSVNHPASDPFVTAAGGTTLPFTINLAHGTVVVPKERPWGWDYLESYLVTNYGQFFYDANYFPVGGGGGVSSAFPMPSWQGRLSGTQATPATFDTLYYYPNYGPGNPDQSGAEIWAVLPPGYVGRNVPDVSLNADPFTGYLTYFAGSFSTGWGGTSFVAPQLNGIAALLTQANEGRLGFLNPQLYRAFQKYGYSSRSPFHAITTGTNLYWQAGAHYNPASGLGTLNVVNLGLALEH